MNRLWALGLMQIWLFFMVYGWFTNKDGSTDQRNYDRFSRSLWTRWMLSGQNRDTFLRQRSLFHKLSLPFAVCFYLLGMYGILPS
jgi:hypothetical protein